MTTASQTIGNKLAAQMALVVCILLSGTVKMTAQTVATIPTQSVAVEVTVAADDASVAAAAEANTSLNMVSWFMGTKQTPKATISNDGSVSSKKQMINAGVQPNRLLIKAFLKKASNYQSTVA